MFIDTFFQGAGNVFLVSLIHLMNWPAVCFFLCSCQVCINEGFILSSFCLLFLGGACAQFFFLTALYRKAGNPHEKLCPGSCWTKNANLDGGFCQNLYCSDQYSKGRQGLKGTAVEMHGYQAKSWVSEWHTPGSLLLKSGVGTALAQWVKCVFRPGEQMGPPSNGSEWSVHTCVLGDGRGEMLP